MIPFKKFHYISEMTYPGNIGFEEMVKFYQVASKSEIKQMEDIIKAKDWEGFKKLINKKIKVKLK